MKFLHFLTLCCFSAVRAEASEETEVRGHVGGDVSIRCSAFWAANDSSAGGDSSVYFCRGACSGHSVLVRAERRRFSLTRRGRFSVEMDGSDELFNVTVQELRAADAGRYHCGVGAGSAVAHQHRVNLIVLDAPTVPPGSPPSSTAAAPQTSAHVAPGGGSPSGTGASPAAPTPSPSEEKRRQQGGTKLTGTTVVIIVSGSLAFLVCAIIPLIFYGHWRSTSDDQNRPEESKAEGEYSEQTADAGSAQAAVRLQAVEVKAESEGGAHDSSHYAAIYQALDPQALD